MNLRAVTATARPVAVSLQRPRTIVLPPNKPPIPDINEARGRKAPRCIPSKRFPIPQSFCCLPDDWLGSPGLSGAASNMTEPWKRHVRFAPIARCAGFDGHKPEPFKGVRIAVRAD
jgi:hypothetical protein